MNYESWMSKQNKNVPCLLWILKSFDLKFLSSLVPKNVQPKNVFSIPNKGTQLKGKSSKDIFSMIQILFDIFHPLMYLVQNVLGVDFAFGNSLRPYENYNTFEK